MSETIIGSAPASPARVTTAFHTVDADEAVRMLGTNAFEGLTSQEAESRLRKYGRNVLATKSPVALWRRLGRELRETVVLLLLAAALVALWLGEWIDAVAILSIVVVNTALGALQHYKAERALAGLSVLSAPTALTLREGRIALLPATELVPGDCVELLAGDTVPADLRLLDGFGFKVQEAALTGESLPVEKYPHQTLATETLLGERVNCAFAGTTVIGGKARGVVIATGMNTELGRIGRLLNETERRATPLEIRLEQLGRNLVAVCLRLVAVIGLLYLWQGAAWVDVLRMSISLAVAAVPEGLPAAVTIALALGVQRMSRRNALVKELAGVETLGSVSVICSDKTGTLTRNEMTVSELRVGEGIWRVTGSGHDPEGEVLRSDISPDLKMAADLRKHESDMELALRAGLHCNHARLERPIGGNNSIATVGGDPTELSLIVAAGKRGISREREPVRIIDELPFDSERKAMSVLCADVDGRLTIYVKGSVEYVLERSRRHRVAGHDLLLHDDDRREILAAAVEMSSKALRVLAVGYRPLAPDDRPQCEERELVFLGLIGMEDPPREETRGAIAACLEAGIRPIMITGDHPKTAEAVGRAIGLCDIAETSLTGLDIDRMDDSALRAAVAKTSVFARVAPEHKLRIVHAFQRRGEIVAMTGDGVNDAPAVKAADIGVSMGITGTQVTKEASDLVLLDDHFATILAAVEEGRTIFANIRRFIIYLLAGNAGKLLVMFAAIAVGWHEPLISLQILWLNLVTDGLPALALGVEPAEAEVMRQRPRASDEPILGWRELPAILFPGFVMAAATLTGFWLVYRGDESHLDAARVTTFCIIGFGQLAFALTCRSRPGEGWRAFRIANPYLPAAVATSALLQWAVVTIPGLKSTFGVSTDLSWNDWLLILGLAAVPALMFEAVSGGGKLLVSRAGSTSGASRRIVA